MDKLLLDTTYLLPIFKIKVKLERFEELFPYVTRRYKILYNPVSIVEAKWITLKLCKQLPHKKKQLLKAFRTGLASLRRSRIKPTILTSPSIEETADKLLLEAGIKDYFDRIIYATAAYYVATLLTEDKILQEINNENIPKPPDTLDWKTLKETLNQH